MTVILAQPTFIEPFSLDTRSDAKAVMTSMTVS